MFCTKARTSAALLAAAFLFAGLSCEKAETALQGSSTLEIYLTDTPSDYQALWIDIEQIMVTVSSDAPADSGWTGVPLTRPGLYNLSTLRNGRDTLLAAQHLPEGTVSKMRLVLGSDNRLVLKDGTVVPLDLPSDIRSGLDIPVHANLTRAATGRLVLDFDASRSVTATGSGYRFTPVIRSYEKGTLGDIEGVVLPDSAQAVVRAVDATDTLEAIPDTSGYFRIGGIKAGTYQLLFLADSTSGYQNDTLENMQVHTGSIIRLDTVRLSLRSQEKLADPKKN